MIDLSENFIGFVAVVLAMSIPIVAIVMSVVSLMRRKKLETELRKAIVENHVEPESIKLLVEEPDKRNTNKFAYLRRGCILVGAGIAAFIANCFSVETFSINFLMSILGGMGVGMLIAFIIEVQMEKKERAEEIVAEEE